MSGFVLGAYAAAPPQLYAAPDDESDWYRALRAHPLIGGVELPWDGSFHPGGIARLLELLEPGWSSVVTMMPRTSRTMLTDPEYGLASDREQSRVAAVQDVRDALADIERVRTELGTEAIRAVQVPSAPGRSASAASLARSLRDLTGSAIPIVIEHCDDLRGATPQKGFLPLEEEIDAVERSGLDPTRSGHVINWARSTIETHHTATPAAQAELLSARGALHGLMFSGTAAVATAFGPAWVDAHLPATDAEPDSLLTRDRIAETLAAASGTSYLGAKVAFPPGTEASLLDRLLPALSTLEAIEAVLA